MIFTVYAIYNAIRDKIYIRYTSSIQQRLDRHNGILRNKKTSFTAKNGGQWELMYTEEYSKRKDALQREKQLKSFQGREFIRKVIKEKISAHSSAGRAVAS